MNSTDLAPKMVFPAMRTVRWRRWNHLAAVDGQLEPWRFAAVADIRDLPTWMPRYLTLAPFSPPGPALGRRYRDGVRRRRENRHAERNWHCGSTISPAGGAPCY